MRITLYGEMKYASHMGGRRHYGHVRLRVLLGGPEQTVVFSNALPESTIPATFIPHIRAGILTAAEDGLLARHGFAAARIELIDASAHDVDSSPTAFFIAAAAALEDALKAMPQSPTTGETGGTGVRVPRVPRTPHLYDAASVTEPD